MKKMNLMKEDVHNQAKWQKEANDHAISGQLR